MRFLVISKNKFPPPPEALPGLFDAASAWLKKYQSKMECTWGCAGLPAGGAVANVDTLEELDAIIGEFPLGPFSETQVIPLVDVAGAWQRAKRAAQAMMPGGGKS